MRSAILVAAMFALASAGPASTSRIKGNPNEANYAPGAKGASYMYPYVHGQDITGHHASAHHHTLFLSEADAMADAADAMEEAGVELPENCGEDAAIDCVAAFVQAGCPVDYVDEACADYAGCNADASLCAEVVMAEGDNAAAMGLASGIRCDPAGRGSIGPDGECICDEGTRVVVVGVVGVTKLYDTAATTTEYGNAMPAYNTCIPDVANAPRQMPHSSGPQGHDSRWDAPPGGSAWGPGRTSYGGAKSYSPPGQIDRSDPVNGRRPSNPQDGGRIDSRPQEAEEEPAQEAPECCGNDEMECGEDEVCPEEEGAEQAATAAIATMVAATLLAAASL